MVSSAIIAALQFIFGSPILARMEEHEILSDMRRLAGMKQRELASLLGIKQPYMSQLEVGRRPITPEMLARLPLGIRQPIVRARIAELEKLL
jgi:transcriptional regulator with XRE-family HTH domain